MKSKSQISSAANHPKNVDELTLAEYLYNVGESAKKDSNNFFNEMLGIESQKDEETDTGVKDPLSEINLDVGHLRELGKAGFDKTDIIIISTMWYKHLESPFRDDVSSLLRRVYQNPVKAYLSHDKVKNLISKGVIIESNDEKESSAFVALSKSAKEERFLKMDIKLTKPILDFISGKSETFTSYADSPFQTNAEHISAWFSLWKSIFKIFKYNYPNNDYDETWKYLDHALVQEMLSLIENKESQTNITLYLNNFRHKYGLNINETLLLVMLLSWNTQNDGEKFFDVHCGTLEYHYKLHKDDLANIENSNLFKHNIVEYDESDNDEMEATDFKRLNVLPWVKPVIYGKASESQNESSQKDETILKDALSETSLLDLIIPSHSAKDLILSSELKTSIQSIISLKSNIVKIRLSKWQVEGYKAVKGNRGHTILLHGEPGTGKTLCTEVIATEMGKQILKTDCNRILSKWFGQSEKNAKAAFSQYYSLCSKMSNPPILLLNEADQILNRRNIDDIRSTDKAWNAVQSIILEELENPVGLIIATTNLIRNFDEAYSRRFDMILEFNRPGYSERLEIWKVRLPRHLPGKTDLDLPKLALYELSGGQITKVIRNASLQLASQTSQKKITSSFMEEFCLMEINQSFENHQLKKAKSRIGFTYYNHGGKV